MIILCQLTILAFRFLFRVFIFVLISSVKNQPKWNQIKYYWILCCKCWTLSAFGLTMTMNWKFNRHEIGSPQSTPINMTIYEGLNANKSSNNWILLRVCVFIYTKITSNENKNTRFFEGGICSVSKLETPFLIMNESQNRDIWHIKQMRMRIHNLNIYMLRFRYTFGKQHLNVKHIHSA